MTKIFILEDDKTIAELLQVALQHEGHEVRLETGADLSALDDTYDLMRVVMSISERVTVLDYGMKIAEGTPREVQNDRASLRPTSGGRLRSGRHSGAPGTKG